MIPPLLASISHCKGNSLIRVSEHKFIFYTMLNANSAMKSPVYSQFSSCMSQLELINGVEYKDSQISNCGTEEALVEFCKHSNSIFSCYDESNAFFGSLGKFFSNLFGTKVKHRHFWYFFYQYIFNGSG